MSIVSRIASMRPTMLIRYRSFASSKFLQFADSNWHIEDVI